MLAGVVLAVLSAVSYNIGFVVEKWAVDRMPEIHARRVGHMVRTLVSSPLWLAGFACLVAGLVFQVLALSRVSISVVQPILASGIVLLLVVSRVVFRDRLGRAEWAGLASMVVALVLIGVTADRATDLAGTGGSLSRILLAAVPTVVVAFVAFGVASRLGRVGAALFGLSAGLLYGASSLATKEASTVVEKHGLQAAIPQVLASPDPYLFILFSGLGMLAFQTGLQRCRVSVLVPVSSVISSGYLVAVGAVIFGEHVPADPWRLALRLTGFAAVVAGLVLLGRGHGLEVAYGAGDRRLATPGAGLSEAPDLPVGDGPVPSGTAVRRTPAVGQ